MNTPPTLDSLTEIEAAFCLNLVPGVGPRIYQDLINRFGSAKSVLEASPEELRQVAGVGAKLVRQIVDVLEIADFKAQLELCRQNDISILDRGHPKYPTRLKEIYDPPSVLMMQGKLKSEDDLAIAIVGTRHCTNYGKKVAGQLARGLAMAGFTIVSGLARGIDAAAHRGALEAGGRTVAVLGGGHLNLYPAEHQPLAQDIVNAGAVLTESLPNAAPKSGSFPRRNRIVSGMSLGVIVVEAAQRSGALISSRLAMEQGREVFAVPGRIDSRMSKGCHQLIRDGAKLVECVDDVLEELGPLAQPASTENKGEVRHPAELKLTEQESTVLYAIDTEPTDFDLIVEKTGLPTSRVLSTISVLEIRRLVKRISGTQLIRV